MLTHHWPANFGSNLQALSTFLLLKHIGQDPVFLNYRPPGHERHYAARATQAQLEAHAHHASQFYEQTDVARNAEEVKCLCKEAKIDLVLAGSDTILRVNKKRSTEDCCFPNPFWMQWVDDLTPRPKAAMISASSEGTYYWFLERDVKKKMAEALLRVDSISVRDRWTRNMVRYLTKGYLTPQITPDPVAVLNNVLPESMPEQAEPKSISKQYLLLHVGPRQYSPTWVKEFVRLAHKKDLQVFTLPETTYVLDLPVDRQLPLPMRPLEWYYWICHSAGMICKAFHTVVSCIFNDVPYLNVYAGSATWLKCLSIQRASKAYDVSMNVGMQGHCYLPLQGRILLSPRRALKKLLAVPAGAYEPYATDAPRYYEAYIRDLTQRLSSQE